jgi:hypothetical protein
MNILQIALIFLIVLILAVLGGLWMTNRDNARKKHMLSKIKGHSVSERVSANPQKGLQDQNKRRAEIAREAERFNKSEEQKEQKGIKKKATLDDNDRAGGHEVYTVTPVLVAFLCFQ